MFYYSLLRNDEYNETSLKRRPYIFIISELTIKQLMIKDCSKELKKTFSLLYLDLLILFKKKKN